MKGGNMDAEDKKDNGADEANEGKKKKKVVSKAYNVDAIRTASKMANN